MTKYLKWIGVLMVFASATACETVEGFGEDVEDAGEEIQETSEDNQ